MCERNINDRFKPKVAHCHQELLNSKVLSIFLMLCWFARAAMNLPVSAFNATMGRPHVFAKIAAPQSNGELVRSKIMAHFLKERFTNEIATALNKALNLENVMEVPRIEKIVVN